MSVVFFFLFQTKVGKTVLFLNSILAKDPLIGRFSPSAHCLTIYAILSVGAHSLLSASTMASRFAGVSMTCGRMVHMSVPSGS